MSKQVTAVYIRISTSNGQKYESQEDELKKYIEVHQIKSSIYIID
jgi:DNA invertase Pin-like site-specific DNA recombinase